MDWCNSDLETYPEFAQDESYGVVLQAGDVLHLPTNWFNFIASLNVNSSATPGQAFRPITKSPCTLRPPRASFSRIGSAGNSFDHRRLRVRILIFIKKHFARLPAMRLLKQTSCIRMTNENTTKYFYKVTNIIRMVYHLLDALRYRFVIEFVSFIKAT